jgi:phosphoglycolate phosphatase-like HAD superfamily hydrolase
VRKGTVVFDIDGVIADHRHRLHLIGIGVEGPVKKDWNKFYNLCSQDTLLPTGWNLANILGTVADIVYVSGRRQDTEEATKQWLSRYALPAGPVFLRPYEDYRPAAQLKLEALTQIEDVRLVVDDDPAVCQAVLAAGYSCIEATWGLLPGLAYKQVAENS